MKDQDFDEFYSELSNNSDDALKSAYGKFVNQCKYQYKAGRGCFYPTTKTINYSYPTQNDLDNGEDKFATLAHESGHLFDHCMGRIDGAHFSELDAINNAVKKCTPGNSPNALRDVASSSDEFLAAVRKDAEDLKVLYNDDKKWTAFKEDLMKFSGASIGVQDFMDGVFGTQADRWGSRYLPWGTWKQIL